MNPSTKMYIALGLVLVYLVFEIYPISKAIKVSADLVARTHAFERSDGMRTVLVLGDSTAVGIGALHPENTIAGRLSKDLNASVENYAVSGETTRGLAAQISKAQKDHYDLVLIQIGANDVIKFRSLKAAQAALDAALTTLEKKTDRIVVLTAGRIGDAPLFPWFIAPVYNLRAAFLRDRFIATNASHNAAYIDLFSIKSPFESDPARYYGPDGLHPADDGYGFWYSAVQAAILARWPELYGQSN